MKFECKCGHIIQDQTEQIPYKALFLPDQDIDAYYDFLEQRIVGFIRARDQGRQEIETYIHQTFSDRFPTLETDLKIVGEIITNLYGFVLPLYECEHCGRIWIQKQRGPLMKNYVSYVPEQDFKGVFRSQRKLSSDTD